MRLVVKSLILSRPTPSLMSASFSRWAPLVIASDPNPLRIEPRELWSAREVLAESAPRIAEYCEAEPVLFHLLEHVPGSDEPRIEVGGGSVTEENEVTDHSVVEIPVVLFLTIEKQKRIDEERQVRRKADVESTVFL